MDLFVRLLPLLKLVLVFIAMLAGIRRLGLSLSILLGGVVILPLYGLSPLDWPGVAAGALSDPKTLRLAVVVALIMMAILIPILIKIMQPGAGLRKLMLVLFDLALAHGQNFQQGQRLLGLFVAGHVLQYGAGLAVLGDDQWLAVFGQLRQYLGGIGLEIGDRLDLGGKAHGRL